jgi:hypothetical protein
MRSLIFFGSGGRPRLRDFHRQNTRKAVRCHLTNVSGFSMTSASRQLKNRARLSIANRAALVIRRDFHVAFLIERKLHAEETILSDERGASAKKQTNEWRSIARS